MYLKERKELKEICHNLYQRNLVTACDGNISMKVSDEHILITPSRKNKGFLRAEDILVVDRDGKAVMGQGKASSEFPMHKAIYGKRPQVKAVVHTHPIYATAFALAGKNIPEDHLIESLILLGKVALAEYAEPGTLEMVEVISPYIETVNSILLKNHGAITYGESLIDAYNKMEVLESVAKTIIMSKVLGEPECISQKNLERLKKKL